MSTTTQSPVSVRRIPDPKEPIPVLAWPTFVLFIVSVAVWSGSAALALADVWPWWASTVVSAIAAYLLFTVSHDAAHHATSSNRTVNKWIGRLSTPFFAPQASFSVWRFIHMQHHRFTNHDDGGDPDEYTQRGPKWQLPLRFLTIDIYYVVFYLKHFAKRPRAEKVEFMIQMTLLITASAALIAGGLGLELLVLYLLPCRIAVLYLAWAFDYLPHHGLHHKPTEDKFKTTRNRVGFERILSPVMLYQNYHLVHHLHPVVPFYRYVKVWRRNEDAYLEGDPALSTARGRPLTTDEYRRLREFAAHDH